MWEVQRLVKTPRPGLIDLLRDARMCVHGQCTKFPTDRQIYSKMYLKQGFSPVPGHTVGFGLLISVNTIRNEFLTAILYSFPLRSRHEFSIKNMYLLSTELVTLI